MALGDVIARLAVSLSMDTAAFSTGSRKAQSELQTLGQKFAKVGAAIGTALIGAGVLDGLERFRQATREATDAVGGLGEAAAAVGVTTDALQEYRFMAGQVGVSTEQMDDALAQLTRRLGDAAAGVKEPLAAMQKLGIDVRDSNGHVRSAAETIPLIADALKKVESPAERAAIVVDLFGRSGQKLGALLDEGSAGIERMVKAARDMGVVISPEEIANADKYGDAMDALDKKVDAQMAAKLSANASGLYKFELGVASVKLALVDAAVGLQRFSEWWDRVYAQPVSIEMGKRWAQVGKNLAEMAREVTVAWEFMTSTVPAAIGRMVTRIGTWVGDKLNAVWDGVKAKIDTVKGWFHGLADAVVFHSYIPDMVDGIAGEMARLQSVMVDPALKATERTKDAFRNLASDVQSLMGQLFPDAQRLNDFNAQKDTIARALAAGLIDQHTADSMRLEAANQYDLARREGAPGLLGDVASLAPSMDEIGKGLERLTGKARDSTVRIAKSFKDMATATLNALDKLAQAIKGGGFLNILDAVIGLGLQLGSIGALGKKIQSNINKTVPGYAGGTHSASAGLAMVGERGPELVAFRGGERVFNNRETQGFLDGRGGIMEIRPSKLFDVYVDGKLVAAAPGIARAGGEVGLQRMRYMGTRRVG